MHELLNRLTRFIGPDQKGKLQERIEKVENDLHDAIQWRALLNNPDSGWDVFVQRVLKLLAEESKTLREADLITDPKQQKRATEAQAIINTFTTLINEATLKAAQARTLQFEKDDLNKELFNIERN